MLIVFEVFLFLLAIAALVHSFWAPKKYGWPDPKAYRKVPPGKALDAMAKENLAKSLNIGLGGLGGGIGGW